LGLVAATLGAHAVLTDRDPDCLALVEASVVANADAVRAAGGSVRAAALDWAWPRGMPGIPYGSADLVIGSELIYDSDCAQQLPRVIAAVLSPTGRFLALMGVHDGRVDTLDAFFVSACAAGLELVDEPRALRPSAAALDRAAGCAHDAEISASKGRWSGYIRVEMRLAAQA
jgi:hypothetical protein